MSETLRTYTRAGGGRSRRRTRGCAMGPLALIVLALLLWTIWTTRDSHPMGALIPRGQDYQLYMSDFLNKRAQIAQSQLWALVPEETTLAEIHRQLSNNFGMPEWLLNNLIYGLCHVSGNDLQLFEDVLFVTRMTRVGCFAERFRWLMAGIEEDHAGGLRIRAIPSAGLYYAVRGRVLLFSPSRETVIRALTLTPEQALGEDGLAQGLAELRGEHLNAQLRLKEGDPLGGYFEEVQVALRLEETVGELVCRARLREDQRAQLAPLLTHATPRPLKAPPEGILVVSGDFGAPLPELWAALGGIWEAETGDAPPLFVWAEQAEGDLAALIAMLRTLLSGTGPAWRLSWHGIDLFEMVPTPEFAGLFDADAQVLEPLLAAVPEVEAGAPPEAVLRRQPESGLVSLPLLGGPAIEPSAALRERTLLLTSSRTLAERLLERPQPREHLPVEGNLYVKVSPYPATQALVNAGLEFAAFGAVRGHTLDSFKEAGGYWLETAEKMESLTLLASHDAGELRVDLQVRVVAMETPLTAQ